MPGRVPIECVPLPLETVNIGKTEGNFTTPNSLIKIKVEAGVVLKWPSFPTGKAERGVPPYHLRDEPCTSLYFASVSGGLQNTEGTTFFL